MVNHLIAIYRWLFFTRNPAIQLIYLFIAIGGYAIFVIIAFAKYFSGPYVGAYHKITGSILMFLCYYSYYKACTVNPGVITDAAAAKVARRCYPYDGVMFKREQEC